MRRFNMIQASTALLLVMNCAQASAGFKVQCHTGNPPPTVKDRTEQTATRDKNGQMAMLDRQQQIRNLAGQRSFQRLKDFLARNQEAQCSAGNNNTSLTCAKSPDSRRRFRFANLGQDLIKGYLQDGTLPNEYPRNTDKNGATLTGNPDDMMNEYIAGNQGQVSTGIRDQDAFPAEYMAPASYKISTAAESAMPSNPALGSK